MVTAIYCCFAFTIGHLLLLRNLLSPTRCIVPFCGAIRKAWSCTMVSLFNFNKDVIFPNRPMEILLKPHRHI